jgi:hypothetical protein
MACRAGVATVFVEHDSRVSVWLDLLSCACGEYWARASALGIRLDSGVLLSRANESEPLPAGPTYLRVSATGGEPWAVRGCSVIELALCPGIIRLAAGRAALRAAPPAATRQTLVACSLSEAAALS